MRYLKVLWHVTAEAATSDFLAYNYGMQMRSLPSGPTDPDPDQWVRFQVFFDNNTSLVNADAAIFTVDVVKYANQAIQNSWTTTDFDVVRNGIVGFCTEVSTRISARYTLTSIKAYRMIFTPQPPLPWDVRVPLPPAFEDSGAPLKVYTENLAFTGTASTIDQFACAITEEGPLRKHWGRFYLPPLGAASVGTNGRIPTPTVDALASAWNTALTGMAAGNLYSVVPNTQNNKQPIRTLSNVTGIHIDDIPDVIRRRRLKYVGYRRRYDATVPSGLSMGSPTAEP